VRDEKALHNWIQRYLGMPQNTVQKPAQEPPATTKAQSQPKTREAASTGDLSLIPYIAPGAKEWWPTFWQVVIPMYDNKNHAQNSVKKMTDSGAIDAKSMTVAQAVEVVNAHINLGADV